MSSLKLLIHGSLLISGAIAEDTRRPDRSPLKANWEAGPCPPLPSGVENFSKERYQGNWFEVYRDRSTWYELGDHCVTMSWYCDETDFPNYWGLNHECSVTNRRYVPEEDRINNTDLGGNALRARCPYDSGFCFVKTGIFPEGNQIIIDTDYNNYSISYSCTDYLFLHE